jgi:putative component of toxin-antitoxin plasmid stabilization module
MIARARSGFWLPAFAAVALSGAAVADPQSAHSARVTDESVLAQAVVDANTVCGSAIAMGLAFSPARGAGIDPADRASATRRCRDVFDAIRMVCKTERARAAVGAQVRRVSCGVSGEQPAVSLDNGLLEYRIEPGYESLNGTPMVFDFLMDRLTLDGQPLTVPAARAREEATLAHELTQANRHCGTSITATFDWTGVTLQALKAGSPSNYCGHAVDAITRVCADGVGKRAVARQIKQIVCGYAAARSISLADGVLEFRSDLQSSGERGFVFEYLQNAL